VYASILLTELPWQQVSGIVGPKSYKGIYMHHRVKGAEEEDTLSNTHLENVFKKGVK